ncbi:hypothetical protein CNMCM5793_004855 [Aspergillus hiratsukae]|uniref:DUF7514 domain-containing protein n=1 Tax=Aspergillus hiratsukae TaxID=1194566 RepID=A0A8H6P0J7_9EURO|nr:hypothetical protein CNMCM5793_004855 [Aspergillus hiratsukae]
MPPSTSFVFEFEICVQRLSQLMSSDRLTAYENEVPVVRWQDELGRLRIWAQEAQLPSLEFRLRDAVHTREQLFLILRRLQRALTDMQDVLNNNIADEAMSDTDTDDGDVHGTEMQMIYHSLRDTINCLFKITTVTLQPVHHPLASGKVVGLSGHVLVGEASAEEPASVEEPALTEESVSFREPAAAEQISAGKPTPVSHGVSQYSQASDQGQKMEARPRPPLRDTTLEKIWGKLFEDGRPTKRLGQLLRGIAVHLIEDYPPGNTIVVIPEKLQKFYQDTKVPSDLYPWQDIFDDHTSSISRLFREVEAEHHLIQAQLNERPDIPSLTPRGFERWATLMIRAHPDKEHKRLQKAVLNMPINNPDNRQERFPKEIPRWLFPEAPDLTIRDDLDKFISKHCGVTLPPVVTTKEELKKVAVHPHKMS